MPGTITSEILKLLQEVVPKVDEILVDQIVIGVGYTAVHLTTEHVGVCFTFQAEVNPHYCHAHNRAGSLAGANALETAAMAKSWDLSESVIGLATMNALSSVVFEKDPKRYCLSRGNVLDEIKFAKDDLVVMVGNMLPLREEIVNKVKQVYVLERDPMRRENGVLPDTASEGILPEADVVIITGTSLANGTVDRLLELSQDAREVAVAGASASVLPDPLFNRGVTVVGGIRALDSRKLLQVIAEGGGTKQLKKAAEFINLKPLKNQSQTVLC